MDPELDYTERREKRRLEVYKDQFKIISKLKNTFHGRVRHWFLLSFLAFLELLI